MISILLIYILHLKVLSGDMVTSIGEHTTVYILLYKHYQPNSQEARPLHNVKRHETS